MAVAAVVVAGGRGVRFGGPKQFARLAGRTVAAASVAAARSVAQRVVLVVPDDYAGDGEGADAVVTGGDSRSASVRAGLAACGDADVVVVHDAARPAARPDLFRRVVDALVDGVDGAIPGLPVTDTVKRVDARGADVVATISRDDLVTVQTPQAFRRVALEAAHAGASDATDDAGLVEAAGGRVVVVSGDPGNVKITAPADLERLRVGGSLRIGNGLDVHRFSDDPSRPLALGLLTLEGPGLAGHSDADAATHALCDALLGAAGLGDLGRHFPDSDPAIAGISSRELLVRVVDRVRAAGFQPVSADVTIVAERPRLAAHMPTMAATLSDVVGAPVSVKATTTEGLGALGRAEGIGATAVALVVVA